MRIIVNADDLGISSHVNARIFALMDAGHVTSSTIIMNAPAVEEAACQIGQFPRASFGIHLNVTEFIPITLNPDLRPLLNKEGRFVHFPYRISSTSKTREAIFKEWCAQIDKALKLGIPVSHVDSHNHIHNDPALFNVLKRIQRKYCIRRVRQTWNIYVPSESPHTSLRLAKIFWNFMLRNYYRTKTTKGFTSFATFHELVRNGFTWHGDIELMCHPGNPLFKEETKLLDTSWHKEMVPQACLISYNEL